MTGPGAAIVAYSKKYILFTGLVREPARFHKYLEQVAGEDAAIRPQVILSTWLGHLDKMPEIRSLINSYKVHLVENPEPDIKLPGHALHQAVALSHGLAHVEDAAHVLRLRSDWDLHSYLSQFFSSSLEVVAANPAATTRQINKFKYRITHFESTWPFFWSDLCFEASAGDIIRSIGAKLSDQIYYSNMVAEQYLFGSPFIADSKIMRAYFRVNQPVSNNITYVNNLKHILRDDSLFFFVLAKNMAILRDYACFFRCPSGAPTLDEVSVFTAEQIVWEEIDCPGILHTGLHTNLIRSQSILDALLSGSYKPSEFGDRLQSAFAQGIDAEERSSAESLQRQAAELGKKIESSLGVSNFKYLS